MARRRLRRKSEKAQRHAPAANRGRSPSPVVREATSVERLAYTRTQAAEALGVSRSTFNRRVLPLIETLEMPWGTVLVPVDELHRLLAERRRAAREGRPKRRTGRPRALPPEIAGRIRSAHAVGGSLAEIARELNAAGIPTVHGGAQWWPSTVRAILRRDQPQG